MKFYLLNPADAIAPERRYMAIVFNDNGSVRDMGSNYRTRIEANEFVLANYPTRHKEGWYLLIEVEP